MSDEFFGLPTHINGKQMPFEIHNPMNSHFSVGRFYGGIKYNGQHYVWDQRGTDAHEAVLVREDLFNARAKAAAKDRKQRKETTKKQQKSLL